MWKSLIVVSLLLASVFAQSNCGPPQCYSPCTNAAPNVDFVFILDVSGSMANPISGVVSGQSLFLIYLS